MRGRSNSDDARRGLQRGREDRPASSDTDVMGFVDEGGAVRAVQGDIEAPWIKTPPFPSDVVAWFTADATVTGFVGNYVFTDPIQVTDHRLLTLWIEFAAVGQGGTARLSLVPQGARREDEASAQPFFSIVVIDPLITPLDLSASVLAFNGFGSRTFMPAELRTNPVDAGEVLRTMIPFDVAPYTDFRFAVGAVVDEGVTASVRLGYSFAE